MFQLEWRNKCRQQLKMRLSVAGRSLVHKWNNHRGKDEALEHVTSFICFQLQHVLHLLLPDLNAAGHYLRHRRYERVLRPKTGRLQINNFLIRQLL